MNTVKLHGLTLIRDLWSVRGSWAEVYMKERDFSKGGEGECDDDYKEVYVHV